MHKRTKRTMLLAASLMPFVLGISTTMAVKGLATAPALYSDMKERAGEWHSYAEHQQADPAAAQSVADTLAPVHRSICAAANWERTTGGITGSPGKGAVSAALKSSCEGLDAIDETLHATVGRNAQRSKSLAAALSDLEAIPEQEDISIFERQKLFRATVGKIKAELAGGNAENLREKVNAQVAILRNGVIQLDGEDGDFGARQASAIASLKTQLAGVEKTVNGFLAQGVSADGTVEPAELLSSGAAILRWWPRMIPQILLAVAVDLSILWMAAFLAASRASLRDAEIALRRKVRVLRHKSQNLKG